MSSVYYRFSENQLNDIASGKPLVICIPKPEWMFLEEHKAKRQGSGPKQWDLVTVIRDCVLDIDEHDLADAIEATRFSQVWAHLFSRESGSPNRVTVIDLLGPTLSSAALLKQPGYQITCITFAFNGGGVPPRWPNGPIANALGDTHNR